MKKWKAIRDCFVKDHRSVMATGTGQPASKKKRYVYYDQLQFLLPHVKGNQKTSSNISPPSTEGNHVEEPAQTTLGDNISPNEKESPANSPNSLAISNSAPAKSCGKKRTLNNPNVVTGKRTALERCIVSSTKGLTSILAASLELQKEERQSDKNGHKAFLSSFVPVLDSMPLHAAMCVRGQISQIFSNYFEQFGESSRRSPSSLCSIPPTTPTSYNTDTSDCYNISDYLNM